MLLLDSKTCMKLSLFFLILSMILISLYDKDYPKYFCTIMVTCWIIGGINLIFTSKISSKFLKRCIILLNVLCIYGWIFYLIFS